MPVRKLRAGDTSISAAEWNRHVDASDWFHRTQRLGRGGLDRTPLAPYGTCVTVLNSGGDRQAGEILGITGLALTDLTNGQLIMTGGSPTLDEAFVVLRNPIAGSAYSQGEDCQIVGACVALVNVTDSSHGHAKVTAGNYNLQSSATGTVPILWKPGGTGTLACAVLLGSQLGGIEFHRGTTDAAISKGSSGTVSRYTDGTTSDSGTNDTVNNDFANVATSKKVAYVGSGGNFYMIAAEC